MVTIVTWAWGRYGPKDIARLRKALSRHLTIEHELVPITMKGKEPGSIPIRDIEKAAGRASVKPGCLRRLPILSENMRPIFGDRIMQIDLDVEILANIDHLFTDEPLKIYSCPSIAKHGFAYGPGLMLMDTGVLDHVWRAVASNPWHAMVQANDAGWTGTDQAIIGHAIHPHADVYTAADGVYSYRDEIRRNGVPDGACMIQYYASRKAYAGSIHRSRGDGRAIDCVLSEASPTI